MCSTVSSWAGSWAASRKSRGVRPVALGSVRGLAGWLVRRWRGHDRSRPQGIEEASPCEAPSDGVPGAGRAGGRRGGGGGVLRFEGHCAAPVEVGAAELGERRDGWARGNAVLTCRIETVRGNSLRICGAWRVQAKLCRREILSRRPHLGGVYRPSQTVHLLQVTAPPRLSDALSGLAQLEEIQPFWCAL